MDLRKIAALYMVSVVVIAGCTQRTILHGDRADRPAKRPAKTASLDIWFVQPNGDELKLVSVRRNIRPGDKIEQAVSELLSGPTDSEAKKGLGSEIPRGTIMIGVTRNGKTVELNLSRRFALGGGTTSIQTRIEQLRRTLAAVAPAEDVYLSVEGKRLNMSEGEGIEIRQPINR